MSGIGWVLILFALAYGFVPWLVRVRSDAWFGKRARNIRIRLRTSNDARWIEWHLWRLIWRVRWQGEPIQIVVMDEGSIDQTVAIVTRFVRIGEVDRLFVQPVRCRSQCGNPFVG